MRIRSRRLSQRALVPAVMAVAGGVIVVVSMPPWLLLSILGAGLLAGAYVVYKNGM